MCLLDGATVLLEEDLRADLRDPYVLVNVVKEADEA